MWSAEKDPRLTPFLKTKEGDDFRVIIGVSNGRESASLPVCWALEEDVVVVADVADVVTPADVDDIVVDEDIDDKSNGEAGTWEVFVSRAFRAAANAAACSAKVKGRELTLVLSVGEDVVYPL